MMLVRCFSAALLAAAFMTPAVQAQGAAPGPEIAELKKLEGAWDTTMKMPGMESKGIATYKADLGGLWIASTFEGEVAGQKFSGKGFDTYDSARKKYIGVWMDSMTTTPMVLQGTYDKAKKTMTMTGEGAGMDGKTVKQKTVTVMPDADTIDFAMYMGDAKEPSFTIVYKRKK